MLSNLSSTDGELRSHLFDRDASLPMRLKQIWLFPWKQILKQAKIGFFARLSVEAPQRRIGRANFSSLPPIRDTEEMKSCPRLYLFSSYNQIHLRMLAIYRKIALSMNIHLN